MASPDKASYCLTSEEQEAFPSKPPWARKPILGFSTWSTQLLDGIPGYGGRHIKPWFNEKNIREISDTMKIKMPEYKYINLDSGWCESCDEYGRWTYRQDLFPSGLRALSDYLAKNGHKLGLYMLPGVRVDAVKANAKIKGTKYTVRDITMEKKEGNGFKGTTYMPDVHNDVVQAYYDSIVELYAEWGVSFIKIDGCGPGGGDQFYPYQSPDNRACLRILSSAFRRHNIWMELSWYLDYSYADDWAKIANGARVYIDIESYASRTMTTSHRVFQRITQTARWLDSGVVGHQHGFFVDLDAVLVGMTMNGKCIDGLDNDDVRQSYVSFWALVSSVFCIGSDPRYIPDRYIRMLHHPEILYIHQSGIMAKPIDSGNAWTNRRQIWWKTLPDGRICCGLFNTHTYTFMLGTSHDIKLVLADIGLSQANIQDVWTGEQLGTFTDSYTVRLRAGQCQMLYLTSLVQTT